ncbi:MAG TPA: universal stress protein [Acidimicrobiales bacterium]|nr:universal stress protein [Acidimicrobiales bacterium]
MDELVVGVDGSDESREALQWAASLSALGGTPLRVLTAWTYPRLAIIPGGPEPGSRQEMEAEALADLLACVESTLGAVPAGARVEVVGGPAPTAILEAVGPGSVLVVGTRGRGGFTGMLLGSVSRASIEYAPCPVVVARGTAIAADPVILVGHDGSAGATAALAWAGSLGALSHARIVVVHAWEAGSSEVSPRLHTRLSAQADANVRRWVDDAGVRADPIAIEGDPRTTMVDTATRMGAALVVVGRRGTSRLTGIATGGVTSYLVSNSRTSIAVLPPPTAPSGTTAGAAPEAVA